MKKKKYNAEFKTQVVLEVIQEETSVNEIAGRHNIDPVVLGHWKTEFLNQAFDFFKNDSGNAEKELRKAHQSIKDLQVKIDQLKYEINWLRGPYSQKIDIRN